MLESPGCSIEQENVFGPIVASSCLNGFDFTLLFEETILTLLPLGITLLAACIRIWGLQGASEKVSRSWLYTAKGVSSLLSITKVCATLTHLLVSLAALCSLPYHTVGFLESTSNPPDGCNSTYSVCHDRNFSSFAISFSSFSSLLITSVHRSKWIPLLYATT